MIAVLAKNLREAEKSYRRNVHELGQEGRRVITSREQAFGIDWTRIEIVRGFWDREDADELFQAVKNTALGGPIETHWRGEDAE